MDEPRHPPSIRALGRKGSFHKFTDPPYMIGHAQRKGWRHADRLMRPEEVVVGHVQVHGGTVVPQLLGETICKPGEPS